MNSVEPVTGSETCPEPSSNGGINGLLDGSGDSLCDITLPDDRDKIIATKIEVGEQVIAKSLNEKFLAIYKEFETRGMIPAPAIEGIFVPSFDSNLDFTDYLPTSAANPSLLTSQLGLLQYDQGSYDFSPAVERSSDGVSVTGMRAINFRDSTSKCSVEIYISTSASPISYEVKKYKNGASLTKQECREMAETIWQTQNISEDTQFSDFTFYIPTI